MVAMIETIVSVFFPCLVTWMGFVALLCKRKSLSIEADRRIRERTLFMYSAVALTLTLTWFCEEITVFFPLKGSVRYYLRMVALFPPCFVPCVCFAMSADFREQVKLFCINRDSQDDDVTMSNSQHDDRVERNAEGEISVVVHEAEVKVKDTVNKQHSCERENMVNREKDLEERLTTEKTSDYENFDFREETNDQNLVVSKLSVRRDSSNEIMEAERSPSAARYVKQGEITKAALIW